MKRFLHFTGILFLFSVSLNAQLAEYDETFNYGGVGCTGTGDAVVYTSCVYPASSVHADKIIIGGRFNSYNGVTTRKLARLNADGTFDATFEGTHIFNDASGSQYLYASAITQDGGVVIGGSFVNVGGSRYTNIIKLHANGRIDSTFINPNNSASTQKGFNHLIHAVAVHQDKIFVGGSTAVSLMYTGEGTTVAVPNRVIKLNSDGSHDSSFAPASAPAGEVRSITVQNDGKVLVGSQSNKGLMRYNADGTLDTAFNTNIGSGATDATGGVAIGVYDIKYLHNYLNPAGSKILVVGSFSKWNNVNTGGIVRLNLNGTRDATWNPGQPGTTVTAAHSGLPANNSRNAFSCTVQPDGKILLAGAFGSYNNVVTSRSIARLNPNGTLDTEFLNDYGFKSGTNVYGNAPALRHINLQSDGKLICSGDFTSYDNNNLRMVIRLKTRECSLASIYNPIQGWKNGNLPAINRYTAVESGTLTINAGTHFEACELAVEEGATIVIKSGASFTIDKLLMNNGEIIIEEGGALLQINEDITNMDRGSGTIRLKRNTTPVRRYDYTYWSSPASGQTLKDFSPNTLADKYYAFNATTQGWRLIMGGEEEMQPAIGYIVRAPQTHSISTPQIFNGEFRGRANNGTLRTELNKTATAGFNLVGNPYPSAIDAHLLLTYTENLGKTTGSLYFWTHNTPVVPGTNGGFEYDGSDYMVANLTGNTFVSSVTGPQEFDGYISSGQGFMVESLVTGDSLTFKNEMRVKNHNTQFYRQAAPGYAAESSNEARSRYWIELTGATGGYAQALVGYLPGATNAMDYGYDGKTISTNNLRLFSILENNQLAVQGRALPLDDQEIIPMGVQFPANGTYTIELSKTDGVFAADQLIYLRDNLTKRVVRLTGQPYTFQATAGVSLDRFEIWYVLKRYDVVAEIHSELLITTTQGLRLANPADKMQNIYLYDMAGRELFRANYAEGANEISITEVAPKQQVLLVKVQYLDGTIETKKVVY